MRVACVTRQPGTVAFVRVELHGAEPAVASGAWDRQESTYLDVPTGLLILGGTNRGGPTQFDAGLAGLYGLHAAMRVAEPSDLDVEEYGRECRVEQWLLQLWVLHPTDKVPPPSTRQFWPYSPRPLPPGVTLPEPDHGRAAPTPGEQESPEEPPSRYPLTATRWRGRGPRGTQPDGQASGGTSAPDIGSAAPVQQERVLFDGHLPVDHGQAYVESSWEPMPEVISTILGQHNGLCGSRYPGFLFLVTGRRYGKVGLRAEVLPREPALSEDWEDVVEVSFTALTADVNLISWNRDVYPLEIPAGRYRVRYSGRNMDAGRDADPADDVVDAYLLQLWPDDSLRADAVLKQTSASASYWNDVARGGS